MIVRDPCQEWNERLVDFVDGDLPESEAAQTAGHLRECSRCRRRADALGRSLAIARRIWTDATGDMDPISAFGLTRRHAPRTWRRIVTGAAVAALLLAASAVFWPQAQRQVALTEMPRPTLAEIQREIAEEGIAAQMLAAADMLAAVPGGEPYACERLNSLVKHYPETAAGARARMRLDAAKERTMP